MDSSRWDRIQALFHAAADLPAPQQRAYLQKACNGDEELSSSVLAMLQEDARGTSVLDLEFGDVAYDLLDDPQSLPAAQFGPYRLKKVLGEGGMGIVYLAEREDIGSLVAIKLLRDASLSPARRARFASEQKTLARLDHPLIARIYDAGTLSDGAPWFVMEYVEGAPITEYCRARGSSIGERLRLFRAVCEAVQYAHSHAFIHRDLKPSNILVKADGIVKLLDFGIAKQLEGRSQPVDETQTGLRPMTLAYAAPEQIRGERLGTQTDVYALGVMLYELIAGRLPFDFSNRSQTEAEQTILRDEPEPPSAAIERSAKATQGTGRPGKTAWGDLDVLALTAMHKDLERRYRSVEALIRDIDHYLKGEPLEARPDTLRYRLGKFVRRHRPALAATAAVVVIFVALIVFFVVRLARARTAAVAEATRTQRIERFMLNLFEGGDKAAGPSGGLQVVSLLDRGVKNARTLGAEPAVQAELYQTLGSIYQKLGKLDQADPLLHAALERRKAATGPDNRDVGDSLVALGLLRLDQGQPVEAERLIREGVAMDKRHLPAGDPAVSRGMSFLGRVLAERGAYSDAIKTLDEVVRIQSLQPGPTTDLADSLSELATAHYYVGHLPLADSLHKRALAIDRQLYGAIHPRVADELYNLGLIQHDLNHDAQAEQYYRQGLGITQSWYGSEHPDTALMMAAVGQSLVYQGRYDDAAVVLQQALATQERIFGKVHPQVAMGLNVLGLLEIRRGHLTEAEADFNRMEDINRAAYGDRHYLVGIAMLNLGEVYLEQKKYIRAERSYREALERFTEKLPPGHTNTAITQIRLGHTLVLEGQYKDAEGYLLAGYDVLLKQPGPQANRIQNARKDLAAVYDALKMPEQARKFRADAPVNQVAAPTRQ